MHWNYSIFFVLSCAFDLKRFFSYFEFLKNKWNFEVENSPILLKEVEQSEEQISDFQETDWIKAEIEQIESTYSNKNGSASIE